MRTKIFILSIVYLLFSKISISQDLENVVVHIQAKSSAGNDEVGAGSIIGFSEANIDDAKIYILSAKHIAYDASGDKKELKVTFYQKRNPAYEAEVYRVDEKFDFVVLEVDLKEKDFQNLPFFKLPKANRGRKIKLQENIIVVGHPQGEDKNWVINRLNFVSKTPEQSLESVTFAITPITIIDGYSGGPVLSKKGNLLGMITNVSQVEAKCISGTEIERKLDTWRVPINLLAKQKNNFRIDPRILGGIGLGALGTSLVFENNARLKYDYYEDNRVFPSDFYPTGNEFTTSYNDRDALFKAAKSDRNLAIGLAAAGGAIIIGGVIAHFISKRKRAKPIFLKKYGDAIHILPSLEPVKSFAGLQQSQVSLEIRF